MLMHGNSYSWGVRAHTGTFSQLLELFARLRVLMGTRPFEVAENYGIQALEWFDIVTDDQGCVDKLTRSTISAE